MHVLLSTVGFNRGSSNTTEITGLTNAVIGHLILQLRHFVSQINIYPIINIAHLDTSTIILNSEI